MVIAIKTDNTNPKSLDEMMKKAGAPFNAGQIRQAAQSGSLESFMQKNLDEKTLAEAKKIMSDKKAMEELLSSPQAKKIMQMLNKEK